MIDENFRNKGYAKLFLEYLIGLIPINNTLLGTYQEPCYTTCVEGGPASHLYDMFGQRIGYTVYKNVNIYTYQFTGEIH